jgi:hypothetical protein
VANGVAKTYIDQNLGSASPRHDASEWLGQQLEEQRKQVEAAERRCSSTEQNDALSVADRQNIVVQKLADLNSAVTKAKTDRLLKESMYRQLAAIEHDPAALDTFPAILANKFIQQQKTELSNLQQQRAQLGEKLGERHPEMLRSVRDSGLAIKLNGEILSQSRGPNMSRAGAGAEPDVGPRLQKAGASDESEAIDYGVLDDVEAQSRSTEPDAARRETGVSGARKTSNIRIVDGPMSRPTVSPRRMLNLCRLGGALWSRRRVFFEHGQSIKTPEELESLPSAVMD